MAEAAVAMAVAVAAVAIEEEPPHPLRIFKNLALGAQKTQKIILGLAEIIANYRKLPGCSSGPFCRLCLGKGGPSRKKPPSRREEAKKDVLGLAQIIANYRGAAAGRSAGCV